eukprot:SAG31_NODE_38911_length_292_cov_1.015544_1_plen_85_part_01
MSSSACMLKKRWIPGGQLNGQAQLYTAVKNGSMAIQYDTWAQQSYFVGATNTSCVGCPNFVSFGTAQDFDFRMRHLKMRGVRGLL